MIGIIIEVISNDKCIASSIMNNFKIEFKMLTYENIFCLY